jgi:signal transduction histidine kinase
VSVVGVATLLALCDLASAAESADLPSFWELYRWPIAAALAVIAVQVVLIAGLLLQLRRRRRVEATLRDRLGFETLLSGLTAAFVHLREDADRGIEEGLQRVCEYLGLDRATLLQMVGDAETIEAVYVWRAPGVPDTPLPVQLTDFPWTLERLRRGQSVPFSRLEDLPEEAAVDRASLIRRGVTSGVAVPLIVGETMIGALTMSLVGRARDWPDDLVRGLEFIADIFSSALLRRRHEVELQKLRAELTHFGRVVSMGELAASIAHELNQPLTAILSNAQVAERMIDGGVEDLKDLREILSDIVADDKRAGEVIRRLRGFVKKDGAYRGPVNVFAVIQEVVGLVRNDALIRAVSVEVDVDPELPVVLADRVQLQQILVNLLMNGLDALSNAHDRRLLVTAGRVGVAIHVSVKDSGPGIPEVDLAHVFEPFYTTKSSGLGMGLAIARSLVEVHGGRLWAENNLDGGAMFTFTLPVMQRHHV